MDYSRSKIEMSNGAPTPLHLVLEKMKSVEGRGRLVDHHRVSIGCVGVHPGRLLFLHIDAAVAAVA